MPRIELLAAGAVVAAKDGHHRGLDRGVDRRLAFSSETFDLRGRFLFGLCDERLVRCPKSEYGFRFLSPDEKELVLAGNDMLTVVELATGAVSLKANVGHLHWSVAVSPDGKIAVTGGVDGQLTLWDQASAASKPIQRIKTDGAQ